MKHCLAKLAGAAALALLPNLGSAAFIEAPVAANAYITANGLDWAWAYPLAEGLDLSYQSAFGWRLPTAAELLFAPDALAFQFDGANVPYQGTDPVSGATFAYGDATLTGAAACATPYFSVVYMHCDWGNGPGTLTDPQPWGPSGVYYAESLVVRGAGVVVPPAPVPVPAAAGLLAGGLGVLSFLRRRKAA